MQLKGSIWAEYAAVSNESLLLQIPEQMTFTTVTGVSVAGNTVLKAFHAFNVVILYLSLALLMR